MTDSKDSKSDDSKQSKIAVILIRGLIGTHHDTRRTLDLLRLRRKHTCVLVNDTKVSRGMLMRVKDFVTYGSVSEETIALLNEKAGGKDKDGNTKSFYQLNPPKGGFEKGGIKKPRSLGGALGDRGSKINDLIKKMVK